MNERTKDLYNLKSSGVLKKRLGRNTAWRRHPASTAILRAPSCISNCGSNVIPSNLKFAPMARNLRINANDSLEESKTTWFAAPHLCKFVNILGQRFPAIEIICENRLDKAELSDRSVGVGVKEVPESCAKNRPLENRVSKHFIC